MSALYDAVFAAVGVVAPVTNLDLADEADRSTWRVGFTDQATEEQKISAAAILANFVTPVGVPDNPTLGDWRVGLTLWGRMDDVTAKVAALVGSSDPSKVILGKIATERLEYSNNVLRAQLVQLKDVFGFTAADVDESLYRAHQVSLGDLSGSWPI